MNDYSSTDISETRVEVRKKQGGLGSAQGERNGLGRNEEIYISGSENTYAGEEEVVKEQTDIDEQEIETEK